MIILKNTGLLEIDLITTMGVNIKECDSPIGYFGTGLKYAICTLLRNNIDFSLWIGNSEFTFGTAPKTIRGKEFSYCVLVGEFDSRELPYVTTLGKNWEVWQAYRELYSNCLDEGGSVEHNGKAYSPDPESTAFVIRSDIDTGSCILKELDNKKLYSSDDIDIFEGESDYIYHQGIRAMDLNKKSLYTYNIKNRCSLSEDRMIAYGFEVESIIANAITQMSDEDMVRQVITAKPDKFERSIRFGDWRDKSPSDGFKKVFQSSLNPNPSISYYIQKHTPPAPKTNEERRIDFIHCIQDLCDEYDVEFDHDEDNRVIQMSGGVLS